MKRIAILVLLLAASQADAQLLRRLFAPRQVCGPNGCEVAQPEIVQAPKKQDYVKDPVAPPEQPPAQQAPLEDWKLKGVDHSKRNGVDEETHEINGKRVTKFEAFNALFEDDSGKLWLVLVGEGRDKVAADFLTDPKNTDLSHKTRVVSMPPGYFKAKSFANGNPSITFMQPDGTKLYEATEYKGQSTLQAIRASLGGDIIPGPSNSNNVWLIVIIGGAIFLILVHRSKQNATR